MENIIDLIKYTVLGIIQGVTEIFPVSSSGHLVLFSNLFFNGINIEQELTLLLMITNMGSFIALLIFYFKDVKQLIVSFFNFIFNKEKRKDKIILADVTYTLKLLIVVIPIGIAGLLFKDVIVKDLLNVGISLIITSILLFIIFLLRNKQFTNDITWKNSVIIGLFQGFAVLPGISRSGITMVGGLSNKIEISKVIKFSFLSYLIVSVPVSALGIYDAIKNPGVINIPGFILAFIFSFIFSLLTVRILSKFVKVKNLIWFSIYTLLIGTVSIVLHII